MWPASMFANRRTERLIGRDKNDMISQYGYSTKVSKLNQDKDFYLKQTAAVKKDLNELDSNLNMVEKFAREKYFMKKDNEDVFVIVKK